jgi:hypothetical protein
MTDIARESTKVNLDELAEKIRIECAEATQAGRCRIDHGIAAGFFILQVQVQIGRGLKGWLAQHKINRTDAYDYMKLAQNAETVRRAGHSSIRAALRMLRGKPDKIGGKTGDRTDKTGSPLTKAAWVKATVEERRRFLDAIGANSICEALSFAMRAELRRRVAGQQRAATSPLNDTISKAVRQALSLQKASKPKDMPAAGVAAALNAINNKLEAGGFDLNNVTIAVDPAMTQKHAA